MTLLYHATPAYNVESIQQNGLDNRRRTPLAGGGQRTKGLRSFIDKQEQTSVKTEQAIFFFMEDYFQFVKDKYADHAYITVDTANINLFYLVVFNHEIALQIDYFWQRGNYATASAWSTAYWRSCVDFTSYMQQQEQIQQLTRDRLLIPFTPEVLLFESSILPHNLVIL